MQNRCEIRRLVSLFGAARPDENYAFADHLSHSTINNPARIFSAGILTAFYLALFSLLSEREMPPRDLPLNFHPAATGARFVFTPVGAG